MGRKALASMVALLLLTAGLARADDYEVADREAAPAGVNLHGKVYMGFLDLLESYLDSPGPAATTDAYLPTYFVFGQNANILYGALVVPSEPESSSPPVVYTEIILRQYDIIQGQVDGSEISFNLDESEDFGLEGLLYGTVNGGGSSIDIYVKVPFLGDIELGTIYLCNQSDYLSGQYLGSGQMIGAPPPAANNVMVGVLVEGTSFAFTAFLFDPAEPTKPYTLSGEADFNPNTGALTFDGNAARGEPDVTGTIADGVVTLNFDFPDSAEATATLYFFYDKKGKKPKLKKPKPKAIKASQVTRVRVKGRFLLMGSLVSVSPAGPRITRYSYAPKYVDVWLDVPAGTTGQFTITLTGPNGKTATAKKKVKIK